MSPKKIIASLALLLCTATTGWAQTDSTAVRQLSIGLDFLTHGEVCSGGMPRTGDDSKFVEDRSSFLLGRTRLKVDFNQRGLQAHAVLQNKAVWGMSGNQTLNLYEGWVKATAKIGLFAQLGRVALSYDDERIIGPNDFATAALSHDVLRLGYEGYGHQVHAIVAYNQNGENVYTNTYYTNGAQFYKNMQTVWYHYDAKNIPIGASLLFMNMGLQAGKIDPEDWDYESNPARTEYQQMFGGYVNFHPKRMTLEGSYYRQTGKQVGNSMATIDIRAWMASVKATVMPTDKYGITVGYDHLSGDDYVPEAYGGNVGLPRHKVFRGFSPVYGSRAKFYGILDYFYESAYSGSFTPGLQNVFGGVNCNPNAKLACSATYHYLAVATKLDNLNRTLGHTIDLQASYQFSDNISLAAGYTQMHGTETMARLKKDSSSKRARWGWFSIVVSPSLFNAKW